MAIRPGRIPNPPTLVRFLQDLALHPQPNRQALSGVQQLRGGDVLDLKNFWTKGQQRPAGAPARRRRQLPHPFGAADQAGVNRRRGPPLGPVPDRQAQNGR